MPLIELEDFCDLTEKFADFDRRIQRHAMPYIGNSLLRAENQTFGTNRARADEVLSNPTTQKTLRRY